MNLSEIHSSDGEATAKRISSEVKMSLFLSAKSVSKSARALARETESRGKLHSDVVKLMQQQNLPQMLKPGVGHSIKDFIEVCSILSEGCMSAGWCNFVWGMHNYLVGLYPTAVQNQVWDKEKTLVSASLNPVGSSERGDKNQQASISGHWSFNSGCDHADWLLLGCKQEKDEPVLALLHKSEYQIIEDSWNVMGLKGTGSKDVLVENAVIASERLLPFSVAINPLRALLTLVIVGPVLGGAQSAVTQFAQLLETKKDGLEKDPFSNLNSKIMKLAEASAEVDTARTIVLNAAKILDEDPRPDAKTDLKILRDTAFAAKLCNSATRSLFESSGGSALHKHNEMERIFRDVTAGCNHAQLSWERLALPYGKLLVDQASIED